MYRKYGILLYISLVLVGMSVFVAKKMYKLVKLPAFQMTVYELEEELTQKTENGLQIKVQKLLKEISSKQRDVHYEVLSKTEDDITGMSCEGQALNEKDMEILCRLVEAEAGGEDFQGKKLVAHVVLNRLEHEQFPDTIEDVVFETRQGITQFSPVKDGRYYRVKVSEETKSAVEQAVKDEDNAGGALYFVNSEIADRSAMKWFDSKCTYLFRHGNHDFFS